MSASTRPGVAVRGSIANACGRWQGPPVACGRIRPRSRDRRQSRWTGSADPSPRRKCTRHRARDVGPATAAASRRGQSSPARGDLGSLRGLFHTEPATSGQRRPASASGSTRRPRSWRRRCGGQRRLARKPAQIGRGILFPPDPLIQVHGFARAPFVCRSDKAAADSDVKVLRKGAVYVRRPGAETVPLSTQQDWEEMIERCVALRWNQSISQLRDLWEAMLGPLPSPRPSTQAPRPTTQVFGEWMNEMRAGSNPWNRIGA